MASNQQLTLGAPSELGLLWERAIERYIQITGNNHIIAMRHSASIGGVLTEVEEMDKLFKHKRYGGSKLTRFQTLVSGSLAPIQRLGGIAAYASRATAKDVSNDYDKLTEFFQDVESYLQGIEIWETQVPSVPQLEHAINAVFGSVLILCGLYTRYISKKRVAVQRGRDVVQNATLSTAGKMKLDTEAVRVDIQKTTSIMERLERPQERDNTLKWLSSLDFHEYQRETAAKHHEGTGEWLLNTTEFQDWVHGTEHSTMWCPGDRMDTNQHLLNDLLTPLFSWHWKDCYDFSSLTINRSTAICYVENNTPDSDRAIAHVYCNYKDSKTQSVSEIWSSIIRQFAEQCEPFPVEVQAFRDKFISKRSYPTEDDLLSLVRHLTTMFKNSFVFIDALDECPEQNREDFIESARKVGSSIRLFLTSRHSVTLDGRFSNMKRIEIVAHQDDIRAYLEHRFAIDAKLRPLLLRDPGLRSTILEKLLEQANGMFLLAHLQMDHLCNKRRSLDVRKALGTLPKDVHQFYDDSLQRIKNSGDEDREFALLVLSYVFCARRPLSKDELIHALSTDPGATNLFSEALYSKVLVFSISSGLIRIDDESGCVRLTHHTLHEHLHKFHKPLLTDRERNLAMACLTYISFEPFADGPCNKARDLVDRLNEYCFLEYSCHHWAEHAANHMDDEMAQLIINFLEEENKLGTCVQILHLPRHRIGEWHNKFPSDFNKLHATAYWGLDKIFEVLVETDVDVDCRDSYGTTPLLLSARHGHAEVARRLLETTILVDLSNNRGETALMLAARNGHEPVVKLILERGASDTIEDVEGWTALHWAILGGHNDIIKRLLQTATPDKLDKSQHNKALILAAETGSHKTVEMLLDEGADVDYNDPQHSTPLHWAVPQGHIEASEVLLSRGADPNSRDLYGNTAIHWTVSHAAIAKLLAGHGADVNATNDQGQSALLWSALAGKADTVETLLELGANIDRGDDYGFTALHAAALGGHDYIVDLLLAQGANANNRDIDGWTPLDASVLKGKESLVKVLVDYTDDGHNISSQFRERLKDDGMRAMMEEMADRKSVGSTVVSGLCSVINSDYDMRLLALIETGADINAQDELCGSMPLTYAADFGRDEVVRLLLEHGAHIDIREQSGRTALHHAACSGYHEMVADLIERGATVDIKVFGWTAMLLAARAWYAYIAVYLVEHGADLGAQDFHGRTALQWSCIHGDRSFVKELIKLGADVDAQDRYGQTALHWAAAGGHSTLVTMLLRHNANTTRQALDGTTALHLAAYTGQVDTVTSFLRAEERHRRRSERGTTPVASDTRGMSVDTDGFTALEMAELRGNLKVAQILKQHYMRENVSNDSSSLSSGAHLASSPQKAPVSKAPPLHLAADKEHDYLGGAGFAGALGRRILGTDARQWLKDERARVNSSPSIIGEIVIPIRNKLPLPAEITI
ncbi:unnamed protein product [Clonostachys solani]|uniref:Ankyrin repeat domain-containing protein 50 n=1 Tax=Clonostachys solani TaxID=160281 RepID=A0A9P0EMU9_9HYPO|nr:unnamed protein product [Clonostachys solani]